MLHKVADLCHHRRLGGLLCILLPLLMAFATIADDRRPRPATALAGSAWAPAGLVPPISVEPAPHARNVRAAFFGEEGGAGLRTAGEPAPTADRPHGQHLAGTEWVRGPPAAWPPVLPAVLGAPRSHHGSVALRWRCRGFGQRAPPLFA